MPVKQEHSRRRRGPSSQLWEIVQSIDTDSWRQLSAFSDVYGKNSMQFQLLEYLRSMPEYDPSLEKKKFESHDLYALRVAAKRWLQRTWKRLALGTKEVDDLLGDADVSLLWKDFETGLKINAKGKKIAIAREDFLLLARLLEQELALVSGLFQGQPLSEELLRIDKELNANLENLKLSREVSSFRIKYLEQVRNSFASVGILDHSKIDEYFKTAFYSRDSSLLPRTLRIEKWTIDEFFFYVKKDFHSASKIARSTVQLLEKTPRVDKKAQETLAKTLIRLAMYYIEKNDIDGSIWVLAKFEDAGQYHDCYESYYLFRHIFVLFQIANDLNQPQYYSQAVSLWMQHKKSFLSVPHDHKMGFTLLYIAILSLSKGKTDEAKELWQYIRKINFKSANFATQAMACLVHVMLLFEDKDELGLESICRSYKRKLKAFGEISQPAITLLKVFGKKDFILNEATRRKALVQTRKSLIDFQSDPSYARGLWYDPVQDWIKLNLETKTRRQ